jgi:uncharacterized membrane protein
MVAIAFLSWAGTRVSIAAARAAMPQVGFAEASSIVLARCSMCHSAHPVWSGIASAPKGVQLDTPEMIRLHAREIELNAVLTNAMPPGNITRVSDQDRMTLGAGLASLP